MKDKFSISIETMHLNDRGDTENVRLPSFYAAACLVFIC